MTEGNTSNQNKKVTDVYNTEEYKALLAQYEIQKERISELEDIVKRNLRFEKATEMQRDSNETEPIEFPANLLAKFFLAARNVKHRVKLTLNSDNIVESWIIE
jgi:hypothetical protein